MADFTAASIETSTALLVMTAISPAVVGASVETGVSLAVIQQGQAIYGGSIETGSSLAKVYVPGDSAPLTAQSLLEDILHTWGGVCNGSDDDCLHADALAVANSTMQFLHANGRELPFIARRSRYYFVDAAQTAAQSILKLDSDIQTVDGYVRAAHPWYSFVFRLNDQTFPVPIGYNPFGSGYSLVLSFDGDGYRVTVPSGFTTPAQLQDSIQALIKNDARVWVTYRANQYLKITFDQPPAFFIQETNPTPNQPWIVTVDFNGATILNSKGFLLREPGGDHDNVWFNQDTNGTAPAQGDFSFEVQIFSGDDAQFWADSTATVINGIGQGYSASAVGGVLTISSGYGSPVEFIQDGFPPTGLPITVTQRGGDGTVITSLFTGGPDAAYLTNSDSVVRTADGFPYTTGDVCQALTPLSSRAAADTYLELYGSDAPSAYYLERQHVVAPDSAQVYLIFAPPITTDTILAMDVQVEPARIGWQDYVARTVIPIPHAYVESLLLPIARWRATTSKRYRQRERHESIVKQYQEALTMLGIVDPQTSPVKEGKQSNSV